MDLAADQKTMFYTSEGGRILRYDVSGSGTQLPDFANIGGTSYALRLLAPGDGSGGLLVANTSNIKRLNAAGAVIQTYDAGGENNWFSLNLDPNGTSFWAGNSSTANFYRFNIGTGAVEVGPINTGTGASFLFGICVLGEVTAATQVDFNVSPADPTAGKPVTFSAKITGGKPPFSCAWDVGKDGSVEQTADCSVDFVRSFPTAGSYQVRLGVESLPSSHAPLDTAICPEGFGNRDDVKAALAGPSYDPPGWTAAHVDASSIVTIPIADILNGTSSFAGMTQAFSNDLAGVGPDCRPQDGAATLQQGVQYFVDNGFFTESDNIHLLVYDDGVNPISFIWLECANYSKQAPPPVSDPPPDLPPKPGPVFMTVRPGLTA